jgi:hypothetical protein
MTTASDNPIHDTAAFFMWVKGIRDIFSGAVVLSLLWLSSLANGALHGNGCRVSV